MKYYGVVDFMNDTQKEAIKTILNDRAEAVLWFGDADGKTWFTDGRHAEAVFNPLLIINPAHIGTLPEYQRRIRSVPCPEFFANQENNPLQDTGDSIRRNTPAGEAVYRVLRNSAGQDIYINEKYLKRYKKLSVKFGGNGPKSPVFVEFNGDRIGLIMPASILK